MCGFLSKLFTGTIERPSPSDILRREVASYLFTGGVYLDPHGQWRVKRELLRVPFELDPDLWLCMIPDSNSMDPILDAEHDNLYLKGRTLDDQRRLVEWLALEWETKRAANVIVYQTPQMYAVHRLIEIKTINGERRWRFKGDNNPTADPGFATDSQIKYVSLGTIY